MHRKNKSVQPREVIATLRRVVKNNEISPENRPEVMRFIRANDLICGECWPTYRSHITLTAAGKAYIAEHESEAVTE